MLEPQGTLFFLLLMVAFGALVLWLALTKLVACAQHWAPVCSSRVT